MTRQSETLLRQATIVGEWRIHIISTSVWHVGDGEEILLDEDGYPWIPGTSIAGALRDTALTIQGIERKDIDELFGTLSSGNINREGQSAFYVYDAVVNQNQSVVSQESRPNVRLDSRKGSAMNGGKFDREYTMPGIALTLSFRLFACDEGDYSQKESLVEQIMIALRDGVIRFGGYRSTGAGQFTIQKVFHASYDLRNMEQLLQYVRSQNIGGENEVTQSILEVPSKHSTLMIKFDSKINSMLIRGHDQYAAEHADSVNIRTNDGKAPLIPGTSLKGLLRQQATRIAYAKCKDEQIAEQMIIFLFGTADQNKSNENDMVEHKHRRASHIIVNDVHVQDEKKAVYPSIRLNKFTAGVQSGGLFTSEAIDGKGMFEVMVRPVRETLAPHIENAAQALLLFAVRDLAFGGINIGSNGGRGFGRLHADRIEVTCNDLHVTITNEGKLHGAKNLIQETLISSWREVTA